MAKRKAARALRQRSGKTGRKSSARRKTATRSRAAVKKVAVKKAGVKKAAGRKAVGRKRAAPKRRTAAKSARTSQKSTTRAGVTKRTAAVKPSAAKAARPRNAAKAKGTTTTRRVVTRSAAPPSARTRPPIPVMRKPPGLDRERRVIRDEDEIVQESPPSSLDLDRSASAVRTGRRALKEKYEEHTETSPALTGGDVDADWESASSVGDEAPGGDNPTPDQDIVDDIGRALGVEYQDNEELKGEEKIAKRDRNRWELDPASSDDWDDR
jgi:uncharacterized protein DUF6335